MSTGSMDSILRALNERAKELNTLYRVEEILRSPERPLHDLLYSVVQALPAGWQFSAHCQARIQLRDLEASTPHWVETPWVMSAGIVVRGEPLGLLSVAYQQPFPPADEGPFLKEERKLIDTIAERLGQTILHRELATVFGNAARHFDEGPRPEDWRTIVELLRHTDQTLYRQISRKLLNYLSWHGIEEAQKLLREVIGPGSLEATEENKPIRRSANAERELLSGRVFEIAARHLPEREILRNVQLWIKEDRVNFVLHAIEASDTSLHDIRAALERYAHTGVRAAELSPSTQVGLKVSLIRRVLSDHERFMESCKPHVEVEDFAELLEHTVVLPNSHGRLGGKTSGLFLASRIVRRVSPNEPLLAGLKVPTTWYIPSDGILQFLAYNNLDDAYNWRYMDIRQIRQEYPHLLQVFKSSRFPPEMESGLALALDELGDRPLIVRSSSLLEDRMGSAFSGKYKSLFLANRGTKAERLAALMDAIAEVYASVFSPDPIQYRAERGLLEHNEEMGIMVQEVVGQKVGPYFLPAFAGVAFSHNELRWSPRIKREDGLVRLVPGLGTRAVDRLADDYPVLAAPGQPGLRVNVTPEDVARYSPRKVDVINLETNSFETVERRELLRRAGDEYPLLTQMVSVHDDDHIRRVNALHVDFDKDDLVYTFEGLLSDSDFMPRVRRLLTVLSESLQTPVDLEFAHDGRDLYLLQCRPQSYARDAAPVPIPRDVPRERLIFTANRYVSSGAVPEVTHVVYVDAEGYSQLGDGQALREVGRAVGALNKVLPKRQFILMGPGRWGSRGDIRLGVAVTYADINNTAVLVEVARKQGNYVPDLSFGTHFFQDLVEASIRYLPLYPDDPDVAFNQAFFDQAENLLPLLLPEFAGLAPVIKVVDVPRQTGGMVLRVLMNGDVGQAVGLLASPGPAELTVASPLPSPAAPSPGVRSSDEHWRWRLRMAQTLAREVDPARFGVQALYVFGSTKNATAGPGSDIDLLIHAAPGMSPEQRQALDAWLEGWSLCLAEANFLRTGKKSEGLLDVHYVTDDDIARQTSYAVKIGAVTDAARPLPLGRG